MKMLHRSLWVVALGDASRVDVVRDVAYTTSPAAGADRQKLDLYLPEGKQGYPVLLFLHGGGFKGGDRKAVVVLGETFARRGVGVAAVGYRLFPRAQHPEQIQDVAKAFAWLRENVSKHGGRADRLFVGGHSAGGALAALLATDEQYLKAEGADLKDIKGVIILSASYRVPDTRADIFGDEPSRKDASPINHVRSGLPPFFLAYAENDNPGAEEQARTFADALKDRNVETTVVEAKDRDHRSLFTQIKEGDPTGAAALAFIREHVDPTSASESSAMAHGSYLVKALRRAIP